ncbi:small metal-binding protein SmbP [Methylomicrobium lacus]|uniref:small metal-binding protein SmbP n=1 Tax=Methylomicrobium lacus TaxID=136992 RepID=UPI0035A8990F
MKIKFYIFTGLSAFASIATSVYGGTHGDEAIKQLEKAIESAKAGDNKASIEHVETAKRHLRLENKEHPYTKSLKKITGENPKQEHDEAAVDQMNKAEAHLKKGQFKDAEQHEKDAETHVIEKEQTK